MSTLMLVKKGFKVGCRPYIVLDGCSLKKYYGGQLLSAIGQDANNHFYVLPMLWLIVKRKTIKSGF